MQTDPKLWGEYALDETKITFWHAGELGVWTGLSANEIRLASKKGGQPDTALPPPDGLKWLRWTFEKNAPKITIAPLLPDKPVVVKMEEPFYLSPRSHTRIFIRIPVWVEFSLSGRKKSVSLLESPTVQLSKTWFGSFTSGELCYWLSSSARQQIGTERTKPYLALTNCQLINLAAEPLLVEKLCLQTGHLSIFENDGILVTDQLQVNYRGGNEISQVKAAGKPPKEFNEANLISGPRIPGSKTLAARTFAPLRNLPGLGISTDWK